jgi:molybdenum cofactor biosynthesis enzyme MoaA
MGLGNARKLLEMIRAGEAQYHFIEVMTVPAAASAAADSALHGRQRAAQAHFRDLRRRRIQEAAQIARQPGGGGNCTGISWASRSATNRTNCWHTHYAGRERR